MVDVPPLHQHYLLQHLLSGDGMTCCWIRFMAVHTLQFHRFSVHVEITACQPELILTRRCILYLHRTEAEVGTAHIQHLSFLILQCSSKDIAIRRFC